MNLGNTISGIDIQPSFKLWWNKYHIKVVIKGNWLIHDAMVMKDVYAFQNLHCWDTMKFAWNKNFTTYFADSKVAKQFIKKFKDDVLSVEGVRSQKEYDVIISGTKILRRQLFFNKYRYVTYKYWPNDVWVKKVNKLNMNAKVSHAGDYWKSTVYLGSKKDVAKMQLATGGSEEIYKVVTLEEI
jgi:hypothetical protein